MDPYINLAYHRDTVDTNTDYETIDKTGQTQGEAITMTTNLAVPNQQDKIDTLMKQNTRLMVMLGVFISLFVISLIALITVSVIGFTCACVKPLQQTTQAAEVIMECPSPSAKTPSLQTEQAPVITTESLPDPDTTPSDMSTVATITTDDPSIDTVGPAICTTDPCICRNGYQCASVFLDSTRDNFPVDCYGWKELGYTEDGVYGIKFNTITGPYYKEVFCDMTTDGGGWTVLLKREDGTVDFSRDWLGYKEGFGNVTGEYWIGNDIMHFMTSTSGQAYSVRFDLQSYDREWRFAVYSQFKVDSEANKYKLTIGNYTGDAADSFIRANGSYFSTKDHDNDAYDGQCASLYPGGWWFESCHGNMLTGLYGPVHNYARGVTWRQWLGYYKFLKYADMKIRPI